jgi:hypothetical protein
MKYEEIREILWEIDEQIEFFPGIEDALIGYVSRFGHPPIALYDKNKCIEILIREGMNEEDALEYFNFNFLDSWIGEYTPAFVVLIDVK